MPWQALERLSLEDMVQILRAVSPAPVQTFGGQLWKKITHPSWPGSHGLFGFVEATHGRADKA